jgi:hypothetical protein
LSNSTSEDTTLSFSDLPSLGISSSSSDIVDAGEQYLQHHHNRLCSSSLDSSPPISKDEDERQESSIVPPLDPLNTDGDYNTLHSIISILEGMGGSGSRDRNISSTNI